uniref:Uncharacterized protein n=1 Tax=Scytosiphon promiscuus TaxID=1403536 RepID=A0A6B7IJF9_9PHAE|nr:hypothetical protein SlomFM_132 [Scytosiphon promiscuus]QDM58418.1 hypothetical protein SlomFM_132 [Scytosiphon promiscuus]QDM58561.1 hypothetical protein SlomM_132 [Scytosiphon promiscuus]
MKVLRKRNKILAVFKSIKDLDPLFFELLMDSIRDSNKTLIVKKNPKALLIIYSNIFATKKLNIPLAKEKTLGIMINKVNKNNIASLYSEIKQKPIIKINFRDKQLDYQLKNRKNLFFNLYLNRQNELLSSQVISYVKIIQSFDQI